MAYNRRTPTNVTIHPVALFSILDHYLRRTDSQDRVIGTLLGTRHDTEVEVRSSFAVLHSETDEQVAVDMDYHRTMYELHHKVNPKEVIVGWWVFLLLLGVAIWSDFSGFRYSTGSNLNTYSALIQNFYSQETAPHQAIHVSVNTGIEPGQESGVKAFIRSVSSRQYFLALAQTFKVHLLVCSQNQKIVYLYPCPWNYDFMTQRKVDVSRLNIIS